MFRTTDILLLAVMISAAAFTYKTKHDAESRYSDVRRLQEQIRIEENAIDVLRADWSLLTQPSRLQRFAERYQEELELVPLEAEQIAEFDDLPVRQLQIEDLLGPALGGFAETEAAQARVVQ